MDLIGIAKQVWYTELFKAGDNPIALNQIVIAAIILIIGLLLAKQAAKLLGRRLHKIPKVNTHAAAAVQKVFFYLLAAVVALIALPIAGIPITVFTLLGGAIAIGVGFGAQNLFSNLISGLILLTERPIRVGDIIEVGDHQGKIADINTRATRVRRFDGIDVLVPNSNFLEEPVVNWTLLDADVRGSVKVGVAYGSPTGRVRELILRAIKDHDRIKQQPAPVVLFTDFGDNALGFEAWFWTAVTSPMDLRQVESDLRYRIDDLFQQDNIVISFPQRDVHLDTPKPIDIRVVNKPTPSG